jgi:rubrerythrin
VEVGLFSIAEIIAIAVQLEINGEKAYRKAIAESDDTGLNDLLQWMAEEERTHAEHFAQLQGKIADDEKSHLVKKMNDSLVDTFIKGQTFSLEEVKFSNLRDSGELIDTFIEFEKDTILFYDMLKSFILDEKTIQQLEDIIKEEEIHVKKLQELLLRNV